jgi:Bacteriodetes cell division protein (FtsL-like)
VNTFKKEKKVKEKKERSRLSVSLANLFSGNFLSKENVVGSLPYIFFLTFLGILYIANGYKAEKTVRELNKVENELKELHSEYITIKSDLNFKSKQSQVAQATERFGIIESTTPPTKIVVDESDMEKISVAD